MNKLWEGPNKYDSWRQSLSADQHHSIPRRGLGSMILPTWMGKYVFLIFQINLSSSFAGTSSEASHHCHHHHSQIFQRLTIETVQTLVLFQFSVTLEMACLPLQDQTSKSSVSKVQNVRQRCRQYAASTGWTLVQNWEWASNKLCDLNSSLLGRL